MFGSKRSKARFSRERKVYSVPQCRYVIYGDFFHAWHTIYPKRTKVLNFRIMSICQIDLCLMLSTHLRKIFDSISLQRRGLYGQTCPNLDQITSEVFGKMQGFPTTGIRQANAQHLRQCNWTTFSAIFIYFSQLEELQCLNQLVFSGADFGHPQAQEPEGGDASPGRLLGQALSRFSRGADPQMGQQWSEWLWFNVERNLWRSGFEVVAGKIQRKTPVAGVFVGGCYQVVRFHPAHLHLWLPSGLALVLKAEWGGFSKQGFDVSTKTLANRKVSGWWGGSFIIRRVGSLWWKNLEKYGNMAMWLKDEIPPEV